MIHGDLTGTAPLKRNGTGDVCIYTTCTATMFHLVIKLILFIHITLLFSRFTLAMVCGYLRTTGVSVTQFYRS